MEGLPDVYVEKALVMMQYTHLCVAVAETVAVYMDGRLREEVGSPADSVALKTREGSLVLGQDQDKPGGGYSKDFAFSGAITDFNIFARAVSPEEVLAMAQCGAQPSDALVTQASNWTLKNVQEAAIKRQELCGEGTEIFLFTKQVVSNDISERCRRLKGYMPVVDDAATVFKGVEKYLEVLNYFIKIYIPLNDTRYNSSEQLFMGMKILYEKGHYYDPVLFPMPGTILQQRLACSIKSGSTLKLLGLSEKMKHVFDSKYYMHFEEGKHFLRGLQYSFIRHNDKKKTWCLTPRHNLTTGLLCTDASSDFPPVGRRHWTAASGNETLRLTLSGCREDEFTCDSGSCVSLSGRCDSFMNCADKSDEDNCDVIRVDTEQSMSVTGVPFSPLEVKAEVALVHLTGINLGESNFVAAMWMSLSWDDTRLEFFNLRPNTSKAAKLPTQKMWKPKIYLNPVKTSGQPRMTNAKVWGTCDGEASHYSVWEGASGGEGARLYILNNPALTSPSLPQTPSLPSSL